MVISDYYKSLPSDAIKNKFRDRVIQETGISYATFYYKIRNKSWTLCEEKVINDIIKSFDNA